MSMQYKVLKTSMGRKYRVPMTDDEVAERDMFRLVVVALPFFGTILLMAAWLGRW